MPLCPAKPPAFPLPSWFVLLARWEGERAAKGAGVGLRSLSKCPGADRPWHPGHAGRALGSIPAGELLSRPKRSHPVQGSHAGVLYPAREVYSLTWSRGELCRDTCLVPGRVTAWRNGQCCPCTVSTAAPPPPSRQACFGDASPPANCCSAQGSGCLMGLGAKVKLCLRPPRHRRPPLGGPLPPPWGM